MPRPPALVALVASLLLAACDGPPDATAHGMGEMPPPGVTVARPLVQRLVEWDEFTGRFEPSAQVEIRARVPGYLEEIHFEDGQLVQKDQLLFVIDRRPFEVALASAGADLAQAEANLQLANQELARTERLVATNATSRSILDQRIQEKRAAEAALESARAAIARAELDLDYTEVRAPMAGRISNRRVDIGNLVAGEGSGTLLTTIVALDPIYFVFDMSETDFLAYQRVAAEGRMLNTRDGKIPVGIKLIDEEGWPRDGVIDFVDNRVDRNTGTIRVRAELPNTDGLITPGQFGRLRLPGTPLYDAVLIPDKAIVTDQSRKLVMTVADDGTVVPVEIRPGPRELGLRVVRRGLTGEERIVVEGLLLARPGGKVAPEDGEITPLEPVAVQISG